MSYSIVKVPESGEKISIEEWQTPSTRSSDYAVY